MSINLIINIIKSSVDFDKSLQNNMYNILQSKYDIFKSQVEILNNKKPVDDIEKELFDLVASLDQANIYIMALFKIEKGKIDQNKDTLLLFYNNEKSSEKFIPEWKKLASLNNGRINIVSINCNKDKYNDFCKSLNINYCPTIKFISKKNVYSYNEEMSAKSIAQKFNLISS